MNTVVDPPKIETERLVLTWPTSEQIDQYYDDIIGSNMFDTIQWDGPTDTNDLPNYWKECTQLDPSFHEVDLSVALINKADNCYIGGASLRPVDNNPAIIDLGYALAPKYHGQGFATEAVLALVDEAFSNRNAERIFAEVFAGNMPSRRVVEKLGFQLEGTHRHCVLKRGKWLDSWILAITKPVWQKIKNT